MGRPKLEFTNSFLRNVQSVTSTWWQGAKKGFMARAAERAKALAKKLVAEAASKATAEAVPQ
ncbi:MAG: hypothetical protein WC285_04635 [Candidatus Gracilibacteria bacterium]